MAPRRIRLALVRADQRPGQHPFLHETNVTGVYPPLGLTYLAAAARRAGFPVSLLDAQAQALGRRRTVEVLRRVDPEVVGLTASTFGWPVVAALCRDLRRALPRATILVGGPQLSLYPEECLAEAAIDGAVLGEGETPLVEILGRLAAGESPAGVRGTLFRRDGRLVRGPDPEPEQELDRLPLPSLGLLPLGRYRSLGLARPFVSLVTTRGCPYRCRHCAQVYAGGVYREHSADRVADEMARAVERFGAREIVFFDETFSLNRRRVLDLCQAIDRRRLNVRWNIRTRVERLDGTLLRAMRHAGCHSVHLGIEAGSPRVQRLMGKDLDLGRLTPLLEEAHALGIETRGYFMIGYPGERLDEVRQTIRLARDLPLDWASFTITQPLPGTDIYRAAMAEGRIQGDYWRDYTLGTVTTPPPAFVSDELDEPTLNKLLKQAYKSFYLRPKTIRKKLVNPKIWKEIPNLAKTLAALN